MSVLPPSELKERIRWFIYGKWGCLTCFERLSFAFSSVDGGKI